MSVGSTTSRNDYVGNNTTAVYSFTFKIFLATQLRVTKSVAGVETALVLNTDYSVSGAGAEAGGSITLLAGNLATGAKLTIRRVVTLTQDTDIRNQGDIYLETIEDTFDRQVMISQQQQDEVSRSAKMPETINSATFNPTLPPPTPDGTLVFNPAGTGFAVGPSLQGAINASAASAAAASASQIAAAASQTAAAASATSAGTSATNAATSETNAAVSAGAAAAALASAFFRDVVYINAANSPYSITQAHNGKLIDIDASAGAVTINLPTIAGLSLPFNVAFRLSFAGNTVTIVRGGTDTIDQINTSTTLVAAGTGCQIVADTDLSPDNWSSLNFATVADNSITPAKLAAAVKNALLPTGAVLAFGGAAAPTGFLLCDGSAISRTTYSDLFTAIGTTFGAGNGSTTFNLPNTSGVFIQGNGTQTISSKSFASGSLGSVSRDTTALPVNAMSTGTESAAHTHQQSYGNSGGGGTGNNGFFTFASQAYTSNYTNSQSANHTHAIASGGDTYTKPGSIVFNHIIKY